ncbi:DJ-1/PfpI family protein [Metamycoplasma equirhinis]|uniref:DJ-1/PfpI family protein n=1 Tax=Metamycoplasma equirhinis TaxID=92402 RepID=UPI0035939757
MKLLILVHNNFNDIELGTAYYIFNTFGDFEKITIFNPNKNLTEALGQGNVLNLKIEHNVNLNEYDAIFIPGGSGAKILREDNVSLNIIRRFKDNNKYIFAICDAPNVLYENQIIDDQINYSSYPLGENMQKGKLRNENNVTVHDKIITGRCPAATFDFAISILYKLFDNKKVNNYEKLIKAAF